MAWSLEPGGLNTVMIISLTKLAGISAALLPWSLSNFWTIEKSKSDSRGFETLRDPEVRFSKWMLFPATNSLHWKNEDKHIFVNVCFNWDTYALENRHKPESVYLFNLHRCISIIIPQFRFWLLDDILFILEKVRIKHTPLGIFTWLQYRLYVSRH